MASVYNIINIHNYYQLMYPKYHPIVFYNCADAIVEIFRPHPTLIKYAFDNINNIIILDINPDAFPTLDKFYNFILGSAKKYAINSFSFKLSRLRGNMAVYHIIHKNNLVEITIINKNIRDNLDINGLHVNGLHLFTPLNI